MSTQPGKRLSNLFAGLLALGVPLAAAAGQVQGPPIHGVTGTLALPANVDKFYTDANKLLEKAGDGIARIHGTNGTKTRGGEAALDGLRPGTPVVVHYAVKGIQTSADETNPIGALAAKRNEATVTRVDRSKKQVTIAFADGTTDRLRLAQHDAQDSDAHARSSSRVILYYSDPSGQGLVRYFKRLNTSS
jgi:hypothetical protein